MTKPASEPAASPKERRTITIDLTEHPSCGSTSPKKRLRTSAHRQLGRGVTLTPNSAPAMRPCYLRRSKDDDMVQRLQAVEAACR